MVVYLLIFSVATILSVLLLWYFEPLEGFQATVPRQASADSMRIDPAVALPRYWDLVDKVDTKKHAPTIAILKKVSDPDPDDANDSMPLTFSKYISMYSLAAYGDISGARAGLFNNYNGIQSAMSTSLYDQGQVKAWGADPKMQTCNKLDSLRATFITQYAMLARSMQDLSGTAIKATDMKDENMKYQLANLSACQTLGNPSAACMSLASQEGPMFSLLAKYEGANNTILSTGSGDLSDNLQVINSTYSVLGCANPNQFFVAPSSSQVFWINNSFKYPVNSCTPCSAAINANVCGTAPGPNKTTDAVLANIRTGSAFTCGMVATAQLQFLDTTTGTVDTTTLTTKLNQMSPYYLSPDTLQYITGAIVSGSDSKSSLMTDSDRLLNISNVINNIKLLTGT